MSVFAPKSTRLICQGFNGSQGTLRSEQATTNSTPIVEGVLPDQIWLNFRRHAPRHARRANGNQPPRKLGRMPPLLFTFLFANAAVAQDATPTNALLVGLTACYAGSGDIDVTITDLKRHGWAQSDAEQGFGYMTGPDDTTVVTMDANGYSCETDSKDINFATATAVLVEMLKSEDVTNITYTKTADGCTQLGLPDRTTVTITSGGNTPTCASATTSAIRFEFASE